MSTETLSAPPPATVAPASEPANSTRNMKAEPMVNQREATANAVSSLFKKNQEPVKAEVATLPQKPAESKETVKHEKVTRQTTKSLTEQLFTPPEAKQAPAPEQPKAEVTPTADDPYANIKENDWKALKLATKQREKELLDKYAAIEAEHKKANEELSLYRSKLPDPTAAEKLSKEHKEAMDRLAILDFQSHPDFRRQFVEPKNAIKAELAQILADNNVQDFNVDALIAKPRAEYAKAMSELEGRLNSFDASEVRAKMRDLQKLDQGSKAALAATGELAEGLKKQSELRSRQAFEAAAQEQKAWFLNAQELKPDLDPETRAYYEDYNREVAQVRAKAERYAFAPSDERTSASIAVKAAQFDALTKAMPIMVRDYQAAKETIAQLSKVIEDLKGARPGIPTDGGSVPKDQGRSVDKMDMKDLRHSMRDGLAKLYRT